MIKKTASKILTFLLVSLFVSLNANHTYASYSSLSFLPEEGTIHSDATEITIELDSGIEEYSGISMNLSFAGPVKYMTAKALRCNELKVIEIDSSSLSIECLYEGSGLSYKGPVVSLSFRALEEGFSTFTISNVEPEVSTVGAVTYKLSTVSDSQEEILPETAVLSKKGMIFFGFVILLLGFFLDRVFNGYSFLTGIVRDGITQRRRRKLERKF